MNRDFSLNKDKKMRCLKQNCYNSIVTKSRASDTSPHKTLLNVLRMFQDLATTRGGEFIIMYILHYIIQIGLRYVL